MTVLELCSFVKNSKYQEVIIADYNSGDKEIVFKDSAYNAILSSYADWEVRDFIPALYDSIPILYIHAVERGSEK